MKNKPENVVSIFCQCDDCGDNSPACQTLNDCIDFHGHQCLGCRQEEEAIKDREYDERMAMVGR